MKITRKRTAPAGVESSTPERASAPAQPLRAPGSVRAPGLAPQKEVGTPGTDPRVHAGRGVERAFSMPPDALVALLDREIRSAFAFAETLQPALTAFGGARVKPDSPAFEVGKRWGEAVLLANVFAHAPELGARAILSGVFTSRATQAAANVALASAAGSAGPAALGATLGAIGGGSSPEAAVMAALLAEAAAARSAPERAAQASVIRSGAGPGMMEAVAIGYVEARRRLEAELGPLPDAVRANLETQGSRILLPFEQETSPFIENLENFVHFLPRRLALTERASGFVVFPGGFGTLNEVFEVMRSGRPVLFEDPRFYGPMVDALKDAWQARGLVSAAELARIQVADGVEAGLPRLVAASAEAEAQPEPSSARAEEMVGDLVRGMTTLAHLPSAVTVIGGSGLRRDDPAVAVVERMAERLAKSQVPLRAGGDGALLEAVARGAHRVAPEARVQAVLLDRGQPGLAEARGRADVFEVVHSAPVHKVLLYENTDAFVVLPGGLGTFDELWEIACLMQTGKIARRPIVLVDAEFWNPILEAIHQAMAMGSDKVIGPEDMKLFTVVERAPSDRRAAAPKAWQVTDEAGAAAAIRQHRQARWAEVE